MLEQRRTWQGHCGLPWADVCSKDKTKWRNEERQFLLYEIEEIEMEGTRLETKFPTMDEFQCLTFFSLSQSSAHVSVWTGEHDASTSAAVGWRFRGDQRFIARKSEKHVAEKKLIMAKSTKTKSKSWSDLASLREERLWKRRARSGGGCDHWDRCCPCDHRPWWPSAGMPWLVCSTILLAAWFPQEPSR